MLNQNDLTTIDYKIMKLIRDYPGGGPVNSQICDAFPTQGTTERLEKLQKQVNHREPCIRRCVPLDKIPSGTTYEVYLSYSAFYLTEYGYMVLSDWEQDVHDKFWYIDLKSSSALFISSLSFCVAFYAAMTK